ncbi:hypothetical protein CpipJ_CPIJ006051 [Culex quinquefasciatus]|uniref:Uncharacterized protein n=1 Tax=Culex quinquefasciatus TaxID=7176 RepID=B0WFI1_CULQU|nr:hypothetical protein CpipJ_CPIJ006051 [Culex quinquefasciatus]|eukprot:XP_001847465.1 hypothetical protein CpipJ_CPIJ006051 [Culex quinquefasciatus]
MKYQISIKLLPTEAVVPVYCPPCSVCCLLSFSHPLQLAHIISARRQSAKIKKRKQSREKNK